MKIYKISNNIFGNLDELIKYFKSKYSFLDLFAFENDYKIYLSSIWLPKENRNQGIGGEIIEALKNYSRKVNKPLVLHPQAEKRHKADLDRFYKSHGFINNKGRNRDYRISEPFAKTMYWKPKLEENTASDYSIHFIKISGEPVIEREDIGDRVWYLLKDNGRDVGKLTIQDFKEKYYYMTYFKLEEKYRHMGYGTKMLNMALSDSKFFDKPILAKPSPFKDNILDPITGEIIEDFNSQVSKLTQMYKHFGFEDYQEGYLIYNRNKLEENK